MADRFRTVLTGVLEAYWLLQEATGWGTNYLLTASRCYLPEVSRVADCFTMLLTGVQGAY